MTLTSSSVPTFTHISDDWHFYLRWKYIVVQFSGPRWTSHLMKMINFMVIKLCLLYVIILILFICLFFVFSLDIAIYLNCCFLCVWRQYFATINVFYGLILFYLVICSVIYWWLIWFWWQWRRIKGYCSGFSLIRAFLPIIRWSVLRMVITTLITSKPRFVGHFHRLLII